MSCFSHWLEEMKKVVTVKQQTLVIGLFSSHFTETGILNETLGHFPAVIVVTKLDILNQIMIFSKP